MKYIPVEWNQKSKEEDGLLMTKKLTSRCMAPSEKIEQTAEDHGVEIPALKSIINPRLSEESPGIDRFFGRSAILFIASNPDWS
jgi:hypothetical protein